MKELWLWELYFPAKIVVFKEKVYICRRKNDFVMKVSEPAIAYNSVHLHQMKSQLMATIDEECNVFKLQQCLDLLRADDEVLQVQAEDYMDGVTVETRQTIVEAALSDSQSGQCVSQREIGNWLKGRMGWK